MFNIKNISIICVFCILLQRINGRKLNNYTPYYGPSNYFGETKSEDIKLLNVYPKKSLNVGSSKPSYLFKANYILPEDFDQKFNSIENENYFPSTLESTEYNSLEMEVGEHLVKVKSKKDSSSLDSAHRGGYDISVNPKYSHVIEIIHRSDNSGKHNKLTKISSVTVQKQPLEFTEIPHFLNISEVENNEILEANDDEGDPEEFGEENDEGDPEEFGEENVEGDPEEFGEENVEGDPEEFGEVEDEGDPEEFGEAEDEGDPEEFGEAEDEGDPEEFGEAEDEGDPEEFGEAEDEGDPEEFTTNLMKDKEFIGDGYTQTVTSNEVITNNNEESAFNEESEGSGDAFSDANGPSTTKTGRILGLFSRRNETFPICTTPKGEIGRCRRLGECLLSEALNNFNGFLQQLCLIRGALVGICCPDNPVIEVTNPDENATSQLTSEDIKQPSEGCGLNTKTRIVGGSISVPHEWTWMVALMRRNRFYCGGVIINNWYILTAAHCVMGMNVKDLTVRLGEYDFNEQSKHTEDLSVSEIKRHAQFVTLTFQHDIALLKLKRSIKYSKFVGSICLPEQQARDYTDVKGTVVGWGTVSFGGAASPILRQVTIPVWKNEDCDKTYLLESIGDSFMCAGSPEKGEDACQGDSGGPLMTVNENGRWEVIGLVSWGRRCGDPTYPGVYTRVTTYLDWIKQNAA